MPSVQILPHPVFSDDDLNHQHQLNNICNQYNSNSSSINCSNNTRQNRRLDTIDDGDIPMATTMNTSDMLNVCKLKLKLYASLVFIPSIILTRCI